MRKVLLFFVLFLLVGCVTIQDKKHFSPYFEGGISPVTIPIQPKHMPCEYQYSEITKLYENDKKINSPETTRTFGKIKIQKIEDNLLYNGTIDKMIIGGKTTQGSLPVVDIQLLITSYGTVLKKEIMFPLFAKNSELHDQLLADMEKFSFLLSYLPTFPQHKITSGDYLYSATLWNKSVGAKLKGYAYYKGRKVIVGEINEAIPLEAIIELSPDYQDTKRHLEAVYGKTVADAAAANAFLDEPDIIINGYVLLDPHTFFKLKIVMAAKQNGNVIMEQIFEAEKI